MLSEFTLTAGGGGDTPVPTKVTVRLPNPSVESMIQPSVAAPVAGGVNDTVSVSVAPAPMVVSSGSADTAANPAEVTGGLDKVMAAAVEPVLVMVKVRFSVLPTGTEPKSTVWGPTSRVGG